MFHSTPESIVDSKSKITYFAICVSPEALNHALLRQPPIIQAYHEVKQQQQAGTDNDNNNDKNNNQQQQKLDIKDEFHCTLQFFSQPKDLSNPDHAAEILNLMSLLGKPVQMTISYVAFTPKIIAARLNIVSPATVAMACSNACPHITIAVGSKAKAVWSNELLCAVEGKVPPHMASGVVTAGTTASSTISSSTSSAKAQTSTEASINTANDQPQVMAERNPTSTATYEDRLENFWKNAKIVSLQNTNMMTILPGQVCAFCNGGGNRNRPAVSPRLMSPQITPSTSPASTPTRSSKHARSKSEQGSSTRRNNNESNSNNIVSEDGNQNTNNVNNYTEKNIRSANPTRNRATESPNSTLATTNGNNNNNTMMMVTSSSSTVGESPMRRESTLPGAQLTRAESAFHHGGTRSSSSSELKRIQASGDRQPSVSGSSD